MTTEAPLAAAVQLLLPCSLGLLLTPYLNDPRHVLAAIQPAAQQKFHSSYVALSPKEKTAAADVAVVDVAVDDVEKELLDLGVGDAVELEQCVAHLHDVNFARVVLADVLGPVDKRARLRLVKTVPGSAHGYRPEKCSYTRLQIPAGACGLVAVAKLVASLGAEDAAGVDFAVGTAADGGAGRARGGGAAVAHYRDPGDIALASSIPRSLRETGSDCENSSPYTS